LLFYRIYLGTRYRYGTVPNPEDWPKRCSVDTFSAQVRVGDPVEVEQRPGRGGVGTAAAEPGAAGARLPLRTHAVQVLPHTSVCASLCKLINKYINPVFTLSLFPF